MGRTVVSRHNASRCMWPKSKTMPLDPGHQKKTRNYKKHWNYLELPTGIKVRFSPLSLCFNSIVAYHVGTRNASQCMQRARYALHTKRRGRFSAEEDRLLIEGVKLFANKWLQVAQYVGTRTNAQCRERYENCLNPELKHGPFLIEVCFS